MAVSSKTKSHATFPPTARFSRTVAGGERRLFLFHGVFAKALLSLRFAGAHQIAHS